MIQNDLILLLEPTSPLRETKDTDLLIKMMGNNEKTKKKGWKTQYSLEDGLLETYNYLRKKGYEN